MRQRCCWLWGSWHNEEAWEEPANVTPTRMMSSHRDGNDSRCWIVGIACWGFQNNFQIFCVTLQNSWSNNKDQQDPTAWCCTRGSKPPHKYSNWIDSHSKKLVSVTVLQLLHDLDSIHLLVSSSQYLNHFKQIELQTVWRYWHIFFKAGQLF